MNHRYWVYSTLIVVLLLLSSCATGDNRYIPVFTSQPRVSTLGFSITPPPGLNWYEKVNDSSLFYLKKVTLKNYFLYTRATELHFGQEFSRSADFLEYVKNRKGVNTAPDLFKNMHYSYEVSTRSDYCVSYWQEYEDHSLVTQNRAVYDNIANVTSKGLICIHPEKPGFGIDMYYLERTLPGSSFVSYAEEGEKFLGSLSFLTATSTM